MVEGRFVPDAAQSIVDESAGSTRPRSDETSSVVAPQRQPSAMLRLLGSSRYFVGLAIFGSFLAAALLLVYGTLVVIKIIWETITGGDLSAEGAELLSLKMVELIDVFLLGIVLYLMAAGFYQLFVSPDLPVPAWLRIRDLDELKVKLIAVIMVMLGVTFLSAAEANGETRVIELGVAVALVVAAFGWVLRVYEQRRDEGARPPDE
jgi:uncharacterized membrane protein YqhA